MEEPNYINPNMEYSYSTEVAQDINQDVIISMKKLELEMPVVFVTDSYYERSFSAQQKTKFRDAPCATADFHLWWCANGVHVGLL